MQIFKASIALAILLLMSGCEEFPVYEELSEKNLQISCLQYDTNDTLLISFLKKDLKLPNSKNCPYKITGFVYDTSKCTSLIAKTQGTDFDGYTYIEILKNGERVYRAQSDFKKDVNASIKRVVTKVNRLIKQSS